MGLGVGLVVGGELGLNEGAELGVLVGPAEKRDVEEARAKREADKKQKP